MNAYRDPAELPDERDEYWVPVFDSRWCIWEHHIVTRRCHETSYAMPANNWRWAAGLRPMKGPARFWRQNEEAK